MPENVYEVWGDPQLAYMECADRADVIPLDEAVNEQIRFPDNRTVRLRYHELLPQGQAVPTSCLGFAYTALLLADSAIEVIEPLLSGAGYFIDTAMDAEFRYRIFVCERVLDILDRERSELKRFNDGALWQVLRAEFHEDKLTGADIFKLEGLRARLFVTDRFVSCVNDHRLLGFRFRHVWNRAAGGIRYDPDESRYEAYPSEIEHRAEAKRRAAREAMARHRAP